jgi:ATP-dependent RNA helicase DeaD
VVAGDDPVSAVARLVERAGLHGPTRPREVRSIAPPTEGRRAPHEGRPGRSAGPARGAWVTFRVTWGGRHGADARKLLAVVCRRGGIQGSEVGAIRVEAAYSSVEVAAAAADRFEAQAAEPDPRNPRVQISRERAPSHERAEPVHAPRTMPPPRAAHPRPHPRAHPPRTSRSGPSAAERPRGGPSAAERPRAGPSAAERPRGGPSAAERPRGGPSAAERPRAGPSAVRRPKRS